MTQPSNKQRRHQKTANKQKTTKDRIAKYSNAKLNNYNFDNHSPRASIDDNLVSKLSSSLERTDF